MRGWQALVSDCGVGWGAGLGACVHLPLASG
jgi:hypothetical protein